MTVANHRRKYSVLTTRPNGDSQWEWEIVRDDKPLGARMRGGPFKFESNAIEAGTVALNDFLKLLGQEQRSA